MPLKSIVNADDSCQKCGAPLACTDRHSLLDWQQQWFSEGNWPAAQYAQSCQFNWLCLSCIHHITRMGELALNHPLPPTNQLQIGLHYEMEEGLLVFSEFFHFLRGYCCGNGCRHCPYRSITSGSVSESGCA